METLVATKWPDYSFFEPKVTPLEEETFSGKGPEATEILQQLAETYRHFSAPISRVGLVARFLTLQMSWKHEKRLLSSTTDIVLNPNYQQIIGMGPRALPLILSSLEAEPDYWFHALESIAGENPVPKEYRGDLQAMTQTWLEWGRKKGYTS
jgi:hypothetical protein